MPEDKNRKRIVVEEVSATVAPDAPEAVVEAPLKEIKEKAQEIEELADEASNTHYDSAQEAPIPIPEQMQTRQGINPLVIVIPGIFLLGGLLGGILFYQSKVADTNIPKVTDSPTIAPNPQPEPTKAPEEVDVSKYEINILNGSGIAGEAGKAKTLLEKAGYTVSSTGNAQTYDFTKTVIQAKEGVESEFTQKLSEALSETYSVDTKIGTLPNSSKDSIVVTIGSTKK